VELQDLQDIHLPDRNDVAITLTICSAFITIGVIPVIFNIILSRVVVDEEKRIYTTIVDPLSETLSGMRQT
jgi:hypothetical protein